MIRSQQCFVANKVASVACGKHGNSCNGIKLFAQSEAEQKLQEPLLLKCCLLSFVLRLLP